MIRGGDFVSRGSEVLWDGEGLGEAVASLARCVARGQYSDLWSSTVRSTDGYMALPEPGENSTSCPAFCLLCRVVEVDANRALLCVPGMESSHWVPLSALRAFDTRDCDSVVVGESVLASYGRPPLDSVYVPCRVLRLLSGERVSLQVLTDMEIERISTGICRLRVSDAGGASSSAALRLSDCRFAAMEGGDASGSTRAPAFPTPAHLCALCSELLLLYQTPAQELSLIHI